MNPFQDSVIWIPNKIPKFSQQPFVSLYLSLYHISFFSQSVSLSFPLSCSHSLSIFIFSLYLSFSFPFLLHISLFEYHITFFSLSLSLSLSFSIFISLYLTFFPSNCVSVDVFVIIFGTRAPFSNFMLKNLKI